MNVNFSKPRSTPSTVELDVVLNGLGIHPDQALVALMLKRNGAAASANVFRISPNNSSGINRLIALKDISYEMSLIDPIVAQRFGKPPPS